MPKMLILLNKINIKNIIILYKYNYFKNISSDFYIIQKYIVHNNIISELGIPIHIFKRFVKMQKINQSYTYNYNCFYEFPTNKLLIITCCVITCCVITYNLKN